MKLAVLIGYFTTLVSAGLETDVCDSPACVDIAHIYKAAMDETLDPCKDFYRFACNNFIKNDTEIPGDLGTLSRIQLLFRHTKDLLITELEANNTLSDQPTWFQPAKDYYSSCMNASIIGNYSRALLLKRFKKYGGWPMLQEDWKDTNNSWVDITKRLTKAGDNNDQIISMSVGYSMKNMSERIIWVDAGWPVFGSYAESGGDGKHTVKTYLKVLINLAVAYGANRTRAEHDMKDVLKFEIALMNLSYAGRNDATVYKTIAEIQEQWPYIGWLDLVRTYIGDNLGITEKEPIQVYAPSYLTNLAGLLAKTSKRVIANYIMCQLMMKGIPDSDEDILNIVKVIYLGPYGEKDYISRKRFCVTKLIYNNLQVALGALYIRKYFSPQKKQKAVEITSIFQDQFSKIVADTDWLDDKTKKPAIDIVKAMKVNIGYPDELLNDTVLTNYFGNLTLCPRDLYGNGLLLRRFARHRNNQKLRQPVDPSSWEEMSTINLLVPNTEYNGLYNTIYVFSGILQGVFYDENRPAFVNYGSLAPTIASNIAESVTAYGYASDDNHVVAGDWWSIASKQGFEKRVDAIIKEYSSFLVKEVNLTINGKAIKDEVITLQASIKIGRTALDAWLATQEKDPRLVGLEQYTAPQIFWLAEASTECSTERPQQLRKDVKGSTYTPGEVRVNGAFRESTQFAKDWNCPVGSFMNPKDKVYVW